MKTIYNYTFRIVCIYIFALTIFAITSIDLTTSKSSYKVENEIKELESSFLVQTTIKEELTENKETTKEIIEEEPVVEEKIEEPTISDSTEDNNLSSYVYVQTIDTSSYPVMQSVSGNLSHYGHDCYGCTSGKTASGYDISDGRIYYTDPTFGSVRIVAAGNEYPLGTILRLTNVESNPIIAIVLDRGGAIGNGKKYTLDLLTESNAKAYEQGVRYGVQIEMLRSGY